MDVIGQLLEEREARARAQSEADERWMRESAGVDAAERLLRWDRWVTGQLAGALRWPEDGAARERLIRQFAVELTVLARQLRGRGWLLDGVELAAHVRACLEPIAKAQKAGKVGVGRELWPYFRACVARYVGAHAEQIQALARRSGGDEGARTFSDALAGLGFGGAGAGRERGASMTELIVTRAGEISEAKAETLRERTARARAKQRACKGDAEQAKLFE